MSCKLIAEAAVPAANVMGCICGAESRGRLRWEDLTPNSSGSHHIPLPCGAKSVLRQKDV